MKLIATFSHWLGRQFLSLLTIIFILLLGGYLYSDIQSHIKLVQRNSAVINFQSQLPLTQNQLISDAKKRMEDAGSATEAVIDQKIAETDQKTKDTESQQRSEFDRKISFIKGDFSHDIELDLRIGMLKEERNYLGKAKAAANAKETLRNGPAQLGQLRQIHANAYTALMNNQATQATLNATHPIQVNIFGTQPHSDLKLLEHERTLLFQRNQIASDAYWSHVHLLEQLKKGLPLGPFEPESKAFTRATSELSNKAQETAAELGNTWIGRYVNPTLEVLPSALLILLGTILTPLAIKGIFFYIIAPIANRRPSICLAPDSSGQLEYFQHENSAGKKVSSSSLSVDVAMEEELLVHPEYIRSTEDEASKSTKWVLDWKYPLTSIASGLYVLTRLRSASNHTHTISALEDQLGEVALIEIPEGSTLVLQPQHVIGVIQRRDQPLNIKSEWRLNSLTAWLTLQLRYMLFSGPGKIIVKGCRGVRIDPVGTGQSSNQAATIGFSGNLAYSLTRCDPFIAYVRGKQELFNDRFTGESGYYISEEMPNLDKKSGITGKGLEGFADSVLKVFGI